jgi:hypothetical protein
MVTFSRVIVSDYDKARVARSRSRQGSLKFVFTHERFTSLGHARSSNGDFLHA